MVGPRSAAQTLPADPVAPESARAPAQPLAQQIEQHVGALKGFALRALGQADAHAAEDLVHDAVLAAMSHPEAFAGRSRLSTWLIGILSHKVIDFLRSKARLTASPLDSEPPQDLLDPAPPRPPDRVLEHKQAMRIIEATLPSLPEYERLAVLLVDVHGLEREEARETLGVTPAHLRVLLHRGRHRLRRALENADV
jgi:RNA polymerase sigma-70 factor (ECF subfamily)